MNILQEFGILMLGVGLGALLVWLQQRTARKQFRQEIRLEIQGALSGPSRRQPTNTTQHVSGVESPNAQESPRSIRAA